MVYLKYKKYLLVNDNFLKMCAMTYMFLFYRKQFILKWNLRVTKI